MKTIDVLGKPCPIPVIEAKKALDEPGEDAVIVLVDNSVAVQNLEKMASGYGYSFAYAEEAADRFAVSISKSEAAPFAPQTMPTAQTTPAPQATQAVQAPQTMPAPQAPSTEPASPSADFAVAISRDTMGEGAEELGKILIKGFIYALAELPTPPTYLLFFNHGAYLTTEGANTIDDLQRMARKGTTILTCGTCVNYYGLQNKLAVGEITDMYGIASRMASAGKVINI